MANTAPAHHQSWLTAPNPLADGIPRYSDFKSLTVALAYDPLAGVNVRDLDVVTRIGLLAGEKSPLQPTSVSLQCALAWQGMLQTGLSRRNPLLNEARRAYWATLMQAGQTQSAPIGLPTKGMSIHVAKGPTGTGKSVTADRFCALFPDQVIQHGACPGAGWQHMQQLVYLQVDMSADGSRGGFVVGILLQMDKVLGTSYATTLRKQFRTVEPLISATIGRLIAHFTGIVFIDEGQLRNLVNNAQADLMQLFLLQLMNSGIPIVFLGNERAFDWVTYSQDLSRLNLQPCARFSPPGSLVPGDQSAEVTAHENARAVADWLTILDGVMSYYLLYNPPEARDKCAGLLETCSGRVARLALTLWSSAQIIAALVHGREHVIPNDIHEAYNSPDFDNLRPLAEGFAYRNPKLLALYPDVASAFYSKVWGLEAQTDTEGDSAAKNNDAAPSPTTSDTQQPKAKRRPRTEESKFAAEQTRKATQAKHRAVLNATLKPEDMRQQGMINHHMNSLAALQAAEEQPG